MSAFYLFTLPQLEQILHFFLESCVFFSMFHCNENERANERKIIYAFLQATETNQPNAMLYRNHLRCQRLFRVLTIKWSKSHFVK